MVSDFRYTSERLAASGGSQKKSQSHLAKLLWSWRTGKQEPTGPMLGRQEVIEG
jgi:hypothetical protein